LSQRAKTDLAQALKFIKLKKKKAIVFVISDFMANGYEQTLKNCCQKHDVTGIQCMISFEEKMPDLGMVL
jgi:hypothetical protein